MRITRIGRHPIWHVRIADGYSLAMTFLRMQEHYESPKFRGKVFDLEEFMDWYAKERGGFTYPADWTGFNVPSSAVKAVFRIFRDHSRKEQVLFGELIRRGIMDLDRFYLIGTSDEEPGDLDHEIRHGMFYCDARYRAEVEAVIARFPVRSLRRRLLADGYCRAVLADEIHAYALTGWPDNPDKVKVTAEMRRLRRELKAIEKKYDIPEG